MCGRAAGKSAIGVAMLGQALKGLNVASVIGVVKQFEEKHDREPPGG